MKSWRSWRARPRRRWPSSRRQPRRRRRNDRPGLFLFLVPCDQVVNQAAHTAGGRANAGSLLTARERSDGCSRASAPADNQRVLLPRSFVCVLRLRAGPNDGRRTRDLLAARIILQLDRVHALFVLQIQGMRSAGLFLRNEQLSLTTVRQSDRDERAPYLVIWQ